MISSRFSSQLSLTAIKIANSAWSFISPPLVLLNSSQRSFIDHFVTSRGFYFQVSNFGPPIPPSWGMMKLNDTTPISSFFMAAITFLIISVSSPLIGITCSYTSACSFLFSITTHTWAFLSILTTSSLSSICFSPFFVLLDPPWWPSPAFGLGF